MRFVFDSGIEIGYDSCTVLRLLSKGVMPMSVLMLKSILTTVVFALAIVQALVGLRLRGYLKSFPLPLRRLRSWHRWEGDVALGLAVVVAILCITSAGFRLYSLRVTSHAVLGTVAVLIMISKVVIARRFRIYLRHTLILGAIAGFSLLGTFVASALWYLWLVARI